MFSRSPRPKFQNHLVFMTFHYRIFIVLVFDKISKGMLGTVEKELGEYFQRLHFLNQWVPLIKIHCRVCYLFDFDLKISSGQVWKRVNTYNIGVNGSNVSCVGCTQNIISLRKKTKIWNFGFWSINIEKILLTFSEL